MKRRKEKRREAIKKKLKKLEYRGHRLKWRVRSTNSINEENKREKKPKDNDTGKKWRVI